MKNIIINNAYDRISKILKNDQHYPYSVLGKLMIECMVAIDKIDQYYEKYPPLVDIAELGAALEYENSKYQDEIIKQIRYKMQELKVLLPDIS